jgi:hypothetical protein
MRKQQEVTVKILIALTILNQTCTLDIVHKYIDNSFWIHLAITWQKMGGQVNMYINGQLKTSCTNIANYKEIHTAGYFILGQSYSNYKLPVDKKENRNSNNINNNEDNDIERNIGDNEVKRKQETVENNRPNLDVRNFRFDDQFSFLGCLFNFNVWNHVKPSISIINIYEDTRLTYCGNATQWADFRQGTRGDVKLKWPTNIMWKSE